MCGHSKELVRHGAEFLCLCKGQGVLQMKEHPVPSFLVGVGETLLQLRTWGKSFRSSCKGWKKSPPAFNACGSHLSRVVQALLCTQWVPLHARVWARSAQRRGRFVLPVRSASLWGRGTVGDREDVVRG